MKVNFNLRMMTLLTVLLLTLFSCSQGEGSRGERKDGRNMRIMSQLSATNGE